jgi:hypothetical protein
VRTCVAIGTQIEATFQSAGFHQPAGWPRHQEDRRGRQPAQQADRGLAVAREDPVLALEGEPEPTCIASWPQKIA